MPLERGQSFNCALQYLIFLTSLYSCLWILLSSRCMKVKAEKTELFIKMMNFNIYQYISTLGNVMQSVLFLVEFWAMFASHSLALVVFTHNFIPSATALIWQFFLKKKQMSYNTYLNISFLLKYTFILRVHFDMHFSPQELTCNVLKRVTFSR